MMKKWTQAEFEAIRADLDGCRRMPAGDWSAVSFHGQNRMIFAPHSMLGDSAVLGAGCELGDHCEIGDYFVAGSGLDVAPYCRFGKRAVIAMGSRIGRGVSFGDMARFAGEDIELGDGVTLNGTCRLFGVPDVDGRSLIKIYTSNRATVYAFQKKLLGDSEQLNGGEVFVHRRDVTQTLEEFEEKAAGAVMNRKELNLTPDAVLLNQEMMAAAKYIRMMFMLRVAEVST